MSKTLREMLDGCDDQTRKIAEEMLGNLSEDDLVVARAMSNMAVDACGGDKSASKLYLEKICDSTPAVQRLFGRVGYNLTLSKEAVKQ